MRERRGEPAYEVEEREPGRAHHLLQVVAENPQVEHVAAEMHPAAVQEHRGQKRGPERQGDGRREILCCRIFLRHHAPGLDERLERALRRLGQLDDEGQRRSGR